MLQGLMTIGRLARASGASARAIRYYERLGLISPPPRTESNYRLFDEAAVERLRFIAKCRALGFSITEISELLGLMDDPGRTCAQVAKVANRHLALVGEKIRDLAAMQDALEAYLERCSGREVPECALLDLLNR